MHAIGVDIGGTKIAVGVVDEDGRIVAKTRRKTQPEDAASIDVAIADAVAEPCRGSRVFGHRPGGRGVRVLGP
ncbi:hypothetical protein GCM10025876_01690 [Demequina litorisediminis]|uniref:ROK family protein n=1 Tax=Demequina litorisediminis TaxID=1849022 RepID=A0ABQ6I897_9MICO|nr:hypothetical protein GCM10025876_01690 [Demequina litorisediminis]